MAIEEKEAFDINSKNEEILATFASWKRESLTFYDVLKKANNLTNQYYIGNQTDRDLLPEHNSRVVENRVFEGVETIVLIATANAHHFVVMAPTEATTSIKRAQGLQKVLERKYETLEVQRKLEEITRDMLLKRFGVMKWCWEEVKDDVDVKVIDPKNILIPKMDCDPHELPYKIEIQEYSKKEMEEYFPDAAIDELSIKKGEKEEKGEREVYMVYEVWPPEMVAWICSAQVLEKKANPYWDFEGTEKKFLDIRKKIKISQKL